MAGAEAPKGRARTSQLNYNEGKQVTVRSIPQSTRFRARKQNTASRCQNEDSRECMHWCGHGAGICEHAAKHHSKERRVGPLAHVSIPCHSCPHTQCTSLLIFCGVLGMGRRPFGVSCGSVVVCPCVHSRAQLATPRS